jgi:hypothetical protein
MLIQEKKTVALNIINKWIKEAHLARNVMTMVQHRIEFWTARDVIEGRFIIPKQRALNTIDFIKKTCKTSEDKKILVDVLELLVGNY